MSTLPPPAPFPPPGPAPLPHPAAGGPSPPHPPLPDPARRRARRVAAVAVVVGAVGFVLAMGLLMLTGLVPLAVYAFDTVPVLSAFVLLLLAAALVGYGLLAF